MATKKRTKQSQGDGLSNMLGVMLNRAMNPPKLTGASITARDHKDLSTWEIQNRIIGLHIRREDHLTNIEKTEKTIADLRREVAQRRKSVKTLNEDIEALEELIESRR